MPTTGLTPEGLVVATTDELRTDMESDTRGKFGASMPLGDLTVLGHLLGLMSNALGLLWQRLQEVDASKDPDGATEAQLRKVCLITGTLAPPALPSIATLALCGDPGSVVAAGNRIAIASLLPTVVAFDTDDDATLVALVAWVPGTLYTIGDRVTNNSNAYQASTTGTSAGSGGPSGTGTGIAGTGIVDGTVTWQYVGQGTAVLDVTASCEVDGPTVALAGDVSAIQTPLGGWNTARNLTDATLGQNELSDEDLRLLRTDEIADAGSTTRAATIGALRKVAGVTSVTGFTNRGDTTNGDGLPPHSFEMLVEGGANQDIVDTIGANQADGIASFSFFGTSGTYTDSEGTAETVFFSRPQLVNVYVDVTIAFNAALYPSDGDAQVQAAVALFGSSFAVGDDVEPSSLGAQAFIVAGVRRADPVLVYTDVIGTPVAWAPTTGYVATVGARSVVTNDGGRAYICITTGTSAGSGGPSGTGTDITDGAAHWRFLGAPITVTSRQRAVLDTTRVNVHSSAVTP
jgi:hypothetical protein